MKSKFKKVLISTAIFGAVAVVAPIATLLSSCSSQIQSNQIVVINKRYTDKESAQITSTYSYPKYVESINNVDGFVDQQSSVKNLYQNAQNAKTVLERYRRDNESTLNQNEQIWLDSYIIQWDIKKKNLENGLIYLGANPITGSRMLSSRANSIANNIKDAINIYDLNDETGDPDTTKPNANLIKTINNRIDDVIVFINTIKGYLTDGMNLKIMPSQLTKKSFIKQTLQFFYQDLINTKVTGTNSVNVVDLFTINNEQSPNTYFTNEFKATYIEKANEIGYTNEQLDIKLNELSIALDNFMAFYCGDYWKADGSYGGVVYNTTTSSNATQTIADLKLSRTNIANSTDGTSEIEQTLSLRDGTPIYGVGFSKNDLEAKNIGIGYMTPSVDNVNLIKEVYNGNKIYQQMLYNNNSINTSAEEIYRTGVQNTLDATNKMKTIAKNVINDIYQTTDSEFNPEIWYTTDPFSTEPTLQKINDILGTTAATADGFTKFNVWLNQEDFFFGREKLTDISDYWLNKENPELVKYQNIITTQGYTDKWKGQPNINGSTTTVSGDQALAGGVLSLVGYMQFKNSTDALYASNFNKIDDYVLSPYNFDIREDIGVGMEGPRGSKQFQYNSDPYYSLQKWSVASLTTHEGAMGHHTQQQYWTEYMPGTKNGAVENSDGTPGYTFVNDAFHEGWAVFTEWFATELGTYGTWGKTESGATIPYNGDILPTDWLTNESTILNIKDPGNPTDQEISFIRNYHGGVYWTIVKNITKNGKPLYTSFKDIAINATKLANMLAYYGFLNESQLRNMRLALDTSVHFKGLSNINNGVINSNDGASIQDERDFMKKNSGLGTGDISSESIRYLSMPSQATGYMLGKQIINNLYNNVKTKITNANKETNPNYNFTKEGKTAIKELFDLILRNGEIPLEVMIEVVNKQFELTTNNTLEVYKEEK